MACIHRIADKHLCALQLANLCTILEERCRCSCYNSQITFWLGLSLGYGLDYLISSYLVRYPWGKVWYPLFGYLAYGFLPE